MKIYSFDSQNKTLLPLFQSAVAAGFPSPADDYVEKKLDLNELIVTHPTSTFFVKVQGESMVDAHIHSGDILVVDRSLNLKNGSIVVAILNGEFTVKRFLQKGDEIFLLPENQAFSKIKISKEDSFEIWGVVSYIIHQAK